jgi:hypothetical protein
MTPASAYPSRAAIERAIRAGQAAGMKVAGFKVHPGGVIEVFDASAAPPADEFEKWQANRPA